MEPIFIIIIITGCIIGCYLVYSYSLCMYEQYIRR